MKTENILNLISCQNIIIPNILLKNKKNLNISDGEIVFLSYLMSYHNSIGFNLEKFSRDLYLLPEEIMQLMSSLCEKKIINMVVKKDQDVMREYLDLSFLHNKILSNFIDENEAEALSDKDSSKIYESIEKEFGRTLSPIEYETIKQWIDSNINEELILEALKEAVLNGVNNLKYIDKILQEWTKKGYKKRKDLKFKKSDDEHVEVFEYDWLEDHE